MNTLDIRKTAKPLASIEFEMVVDNFAGAGGASMGIEAALGRAVDVAVNHDPIAIRTHEANHPNTRHYTQDIWEVDPLEVCAGRPVGLAWFSPDCKHFSRAKGGKPVKRKIRSLAWVVIRWAKLVKPRVIILENVPEFKDWGPLIQTAKGPMPDPKRKGETFRHWLGMLRRAGYNVDFRELVAADYGVPTIRKRFFLIARCDGQPIAWPERTHWPRKDAAADLFGHRRTWRAAAECIDWTLPCRSIFERKRPLADNTLRRVAYGVKKFIFDASEPFLVVCNHGGDGFRGQGLKDPMNTLTGSRDAYGLVVPFVAGVGGRAGQSLPRDGRDPMGTTTTKADAALVAPTLIQTGYGEREGQAPRALDLKNPLGTVVSGGKHAVVAAFLNKHYGGVIGTDLEKPVGTITQSDHHSVTAAFMTKFRGTSRHGSDMREPVPSVCAGGYHYGEVRAYLMKYFGTAIGSDLRDPASTLTARHRLALVMIKGWLYQIVDIGLRMLTPRELLRAQMGRFAPEYVLVGNQSQQVAGIGNSVCPEMAEALVKANVVIQRVAA